MAPLALFVAALAVASTQAYEIRKVAPATSGLLATEVLPQAQYSLPLTGKTTRSKAKQAALQTLRRRSSNYTTAILAGSGKDQEYLTDITVGGQKFKVIVDTGSSDTWLAEKGFKCYNLTSYPESQSTCAFGPLYDPKSSKTYTLAPNKNFNISYGDGEFLTGTAAFETVTVGGLTVTKQEIGVVNSAAWGGDTINSGLMGLAYPGLTSVYKGDNPDTDGPNTTAQYNPVFHTAIAEKVVANPYFSVALNRGSIAAQTNESYDPNLGYLAFGGIAPVNTTDSAVTVPVQGSSISPSGNKTGYFFYTVDIGEYIFPGSTAKGLGLTGAGKQAILDTGNTLNYVPTNLAKAYNAQFSPPAKFVEDEDMYYVACNATVPKFDVVIGGKTFTVDAKDQILPLGTNAKGEEVCISGTQDGGDPSDPETLYIMGDVFLHNVVSTFNVISNTITLTQRTAY
ncbi:acid protease [Athelia psychrophila]|uniref:Acid protease n=1 Tax=Athelia psychrophila TaxID=1759441 RepID=A0A166A0Z8_9AGAM|nr:acid protease [Fibularhizoctonia sp. CBS 109695]